MEGWGKGRTGTRGLLPLPCENRETITLYIFYPASTTSPMVRGCLVSVVGLRSTKQPLTHYSDGRRKGLESASHVPGRSRPEPLFCHRSSTVGTLGRTRESVNTGSGAEERTLGRRVGPSTP